MSLLKKHTNEQKRNPTKHGHFYMDLEPQTESPLASPGVLPLASLRGGLGTQ